MNILQLLMLYVAVGVGATLAAFLRHRREVQPLDLVLLLTLWPLFGPFFLLQTSGAPAAPAPRFDATSPMGASDDLLDALRRAGGAPLASLLPDIETGRRLSRRLQVAMRRVEEIDRLLQQAEFSEESALHHQRELQEAGDARSAAMVDSRLQIIRRLRRMRDAFTREINQIRELLTQLQIQAEVVRIAGMTDPDTRDLVEELVARIQGLEEFLEEDHIAFAETA